MNSNEAVQTSLGFSLFKIYTVCIDLCHAFPLSQKEVVVAANKSVLEREKCKIKQNRTIEV